MSREIINIGSFVGDPNADPLRSSFEKTNMNFESLFARLALVESLNLPSQLPQGADVSGAPRRLVPTSGGQVVASHAVLGSVDSAAQVASIFNTIGVCRLSVSRVLLAFQPGNGVPTGERDNQANASQNVALQIVKIATDGTTTFGPRRLVGHITGSNTNFPFLTVGGIARLDDHRAIVTTTSGLALSVDYDAATDTLAVTRSTNAPTYSSGNNTHLYLTSDGMVALPQSGGVNLFAQTLSGSIVGLASAMTSPATDYLGADTFISAGGSSVPGVDGVRLTLCLYRIVRGFPQLIDRLVTPHAFTSGASVYSLSSDSAVVSWSPTSGTRAGGIVTVANDRISLASWTPNGILGSTLWGCLPLSPKRFLALVQTNNANNEPNSSLAGAYVWRALELVDAVLVEKESFPVVYNVAGQTSGLRGLDAVVLDADRVLLAGISSNGAIGVKTVRFG